MCVVQFDALYDAPASGGAPQSMPVQETIFAEQLRPVPPAPPEGWFNMLAPGMPLELKHEDGWWQVCPTRNSSRSCANLSQPFHP